MKNIALITYSEIPLLTEDDQLVFAELLKSGYNIIPVIWDDPDIDWKAFDLLVIRSCWDYHLKYKQFISWLTYIKKINIPVLNNPGLIKWNARKNYLQKLYSNGIEIVDTSWIGEFSADYILKIMNQKNWTRAVLKPQISASAYNTVLLDRQNIKKQIRQLDSNIKFWMLQEFIPEIAENGELSLIYFAGRFSHAVNKIPGKADFRSQPEFGSQIITHRPGTGLLAQTDKIFSFFNDYILYARVDGFIRKSRFILMELELIEPFLFLKFSDGAAKKLADEIIYFLES